MRLNLVTMGLQHERATLEAACRRMPPAVVQFLLDSAWIVGVGRGLDGWNLQGQRYPSSGVLTLIGLDGKMSPARLVSVFSHEVGHAWLFPLAPPESVPSLRERRRRASLPKRLAIEWRRPDLLATEVLRDGRRDERDERQAAALRALGDSPGQPLIRTTADVGRSAAMRGLQI